MTLSEFDISEDLYVQICDAIDQASRVQAIKIIRDATKGQQIRPTLQTCKEMVDSICTERILQGYGLALDTLDIYAGAELAPRIRFRVRREHR